MKKAFVIILVIITIVSTSFYVYEARAFKNYKDNLAYCQVCFFDQNVAMTLKGDQHFYQPYSNANILFLENNINIYNKATNSDLTNHDVSLFLAETAPSVPFNPLTQKTYANAGNEKINKFVCWMLDNQQNGLGIKSTS